jgi:hypothetical protein
LGDRWFRNNSLQRHPFSYNYPGRTSFSGNHIKRNTRDSKSAFVLSHLLVFFLLFWLNKIIRPEANKMCTAGKIICRPSDHLMGWWNNAKRIEYGITMAERNYIVFGPLALNPGRLTMAFKQNYDRPSDQATERPSDRATERPSHRATERWTERSSDRMAERPSDRAIERPSDRATERTSHRPTDRATERWSDRAVERPSDRATDRPIDRAIDRATERQDTLFDDKYSSSWQKHFGGGIYEACFCTCNAFHILSVLFASAMLAILSRTVQPHLALTTPSVIAEPSLIA